MVSNPEGAASATKWRSGCRCTAWRGSMGHDSLDTTMVYVRSTQGDLQRAAEEIAWA